MAKKKPGALIPSSGSGRGESGPHFQDPPFKVSRRSFMLGMAGLATLSLPIPSMAVGLFEPFSFAFVSDVHLASGIPDSYKLVHESQLFLQDVVKQLNAEKVDFVIFGGDQVELLGPKEANWQLFLDVVQSLECPWSFVLGEHDLADSVPVDKMRTYGPDWKGRGIESDRPYWSQNPLPGVHIIGLDTSLPNTTQGDVSPRQLEWLKKDLSANKRRFIMVFSHHPLLPPPPFDSGPPWDEYVLQQGSAVREILGSSPFVRMAISGHVHVAKVQQERDIWYVSAPSLNVYPCAYRIFRVTPENVTMESRQVSFPALIKKARKMLIASNIAYKYDNTKPEAFVLLAEGKREDRNALLAFERGSSPKPVSPKKQKPVKAKKTKKAKQSKEKKPVETKPSEPEKESQSPEKAAPAGEINQPLQSPPGNGGGQATPGGAQGDEGNLKQQ